MTNLVRNFLLRAYSCHSMPFVDYTFNVADGALVLRSGPPVSCFIALRILRLVAAEENYT